MRKLRCVISINVPVVISCLLIATFQIKANAQSSSGADAKSKAITVQPVNINRLTAMKDSAKNCIVFKFWIPNCPTAVQQFKEYMDFSKRYKGRVVFIGITNMPQKIIDIALKNSFAGTAYMLDTTIAQDIYKRYDVICQQLSSAFHLKEGNFSTLVIDKKKILQENVNGFPDYLFNSCL